MKTAMQLMLEDLELRYKVLSNAEMLQACGAIEGTIDYAKSLIIKEKEQIVDAYADGIDHDYTDLDIEFGIADSDRQNHAEKYYNQTYNQNK
jgi:hypothetical protein